MAGPPLPAAPTRIGVLALQGDFAAHAQVLTGLGVAATEVRTPEALADVDGLVIPGGESTTLLKLMGERFPPALRAYHAAGRPIYGTCAGLILVAREVLGPRQPSLGLIDVSVERNAYGRQRESFEADALADLGAGPLGLHLIFIRAPRILAVGPGVATLAAWQGEPVLVREGTVLAGTFHPELSGDPAVHRYFLDMVREAGASGADRRTKERDHAGTHPPRARRRDRHDRARPARQAQLPEHRDVPASRRAHGGARRGR